MRKLRESITAKIIAWIFCILSIIGVIGLGVCILFGLSDGLFEQSREQILKYAYENANKSYSLEAFRNRGNSAHAESLRENYFKYGIIAAENFEKMNFHDQQAYLDTNMTESELADIDPDQLFLYQIIEMDNKSLITKSMEYYGDYEDISVLNELISMDSGWSYLYADRICYDVIKGIVYYRAEGKYYPVQNLSLCYRGGEGQITYNYNYDFNKKGYQLNYKSPGDKTVLVDDSASAEVQMAEEATDLGIEEEKQAENIAQVTVTDEIENILSGDIVNFADLNDTTFHYNNWGTILLDGIRRIRGDELTLINSNSLAEDLFVNTEGYYLNEDYTLVARKDILSDVYWVVSVVPDDVPAELVYNKYNTESWYINIFYDLMDRNIFQGFGLSIFVMVLSFGFLIYAAGHRKGLDGIVFTPIDKIPIDVFSIVVCAAEFALLLFLDIIMEKTGVYKSPYASIELCGLFCVMMTVIAIAYVLSLCVRVKAGKWWRNSICYRIYSWIRGIVINVLKNVSLLWGVFLMIGIIAVIEICISRSYNRDFIMMFLLLEKLVIGAAIGVLVLQIYELQKAGQCMAEGDLSYKINTEKMFWECRKHGENLNKISEGMSKAVDERMKSERLKTELITNVSHDIKTPLTSIINYVDLLSKEELHNEKAAEYIEVLDRQSSKLKKLIEDLVEASKASSGNLAVDCQQLEAGVFVTQTVGEFEEKLAMAGLELIVRKPEEPVYIMADGRHIWRVIDNLMNNICKYAQTNSRVYINLEATDKRVSIIFRNISKYPLNISGEELMERFVRGDRSRNTEGHGLGLSIAQSLMKLIGGDMNIVVDGDLFKVVLAFDRYQPKLHVLILEKEETEKEKNGR